MVSAQQSLALQVSEVSANGHCGDTEAAGKVFNGDFAVAEKFFEDGLPSASRP
jgi:hypothetical protein